MAQRIKDFKNFVLGKGGVVVFPNEEGDKSAEITVHPEPSFEEMNALLLGDPDVSASSEYIGDLVAGRGFETSMNSKYTEKSTIQIGDKESEPMTAKEIVDQKCTQFGLDQLNQEIAKDIAGFGNSVIWRGNPEKILVLHRIIPSIIESFKFADFDLSAITLSGRKKLDAKEVTWFSMNHYGVGEQALIGIGILQILLTPFKGRESFAEIKAKTQKSMAKQIQRFSSYNEILVLEGVPDADVPGYNAKYQRMNENGRMTTNKPARFERSVPERMRGLDYYVDNLMNSYYLGLKTPYPKIILGGSFTEASAQAAAALGECKIYSIQRYIKRVVETEFFNRWVAEAGLDPNQAKVKLNWRQIQKPDINVLLPIIAKHRELGDFSRSEVRHIYADLGLPIEPEEVPQQPAQITSPETAPKPDQPILSAQKKHEENPKVT